MTSSICPLCGTAATPLATVTDHFFGSPGAWQYYHCTAGECGVAFPAPAPTDDELAHAYSSYYTHEDSGGTVLPGWVEAQLSQMVRHAPAALRRLPIFGWLAEQVSWELGGLIPHRGMVVDIGSGDGARLRRLRNAGWQEVVGVEPDPQAVRVAQEASIDVRLGSAEKIPLKDAVADAALMHHVIEHVRSPQLAFEEANRILKSGGELSIVTPNIDSLGHDRWGQYWRGFEAPRHLTIFTAKSLARLAKNTGFETVCIRSSARSSAWIDAVSAQAAGEQRLAVSRLGQIRRAEQVYRQQTKPGSQECGEELVFIARKR